MACLTWIVGFLHDTRTLWQVRSERAFARQIYKVNPGRLSVVDDLFIESGILLIIPKSNGTGPTGPGCNAAGPDESVPLILPFTAIALLPEISLLVLVGQLCTPGRYSQPTFAGAGELPAASMCNSCPRSLSSSSHVLELVLNGKRRASCHPSNVQDITEYFHWPLAQPDGKPFRRAGKKLHRLWTSACETSHKMHMLQNRSKPLVKPRSGLATFC